MNARTGGLPDEVARWRLLVFASASLPSEDEGGRIAMSGRLSSTDPTTRRYRRDLPESLERLDTGASDWLLLSSQVLSGLPSGCMWPAGTGGT